MTDNSQVAEKRGAWDQFHDLDHDLANTIYMMDGALRLLLEMDYERKDGSRNTELDIADAIVRVSYRDLKKLRKDLEAFYAAHCRSKKED